MARVLHTMHWLGVRTLRFREDTQGAEVAAYRGTFGVEAGEPGSTRDLDSLRGQRAL